jgi:hypothetical protein
MEVYPLSSSSSRIAKLPYTAITRAIKKFTIRSVNERSLKLEIKENVAESMANTTNRIKKLI